MRILIANDGLHAHYYQRMALANGLTALGEDVAFWDISTCSAFDVFDNFQPDAFLGQSYNLDQSTIKCIMERPHLKVGLRVGDFKNDNPHILSIKKKEKNNLLELQESTGQVKFVHIHYTPEGVEQTHSEYGQYGLNPVSLMMCADVHSYYHSKYDKTLSCDIGFVGGFWPYKGQVITPYLFPLLEESRGYNVKIFGNQPWRVNQYCGNIKDNKVKDLFASAQVCPNLSEPHAQEFGFDVNERIFKILCAGGFCLSDNVEGYKMFGDGIAIADSPKDFHEKIEYYTRDSSGIVENDIRSRMGHEFVMKNHTNIHRAADVISYFGHDIPDDLDKVIKGVIGE
jgi:spore maturation protein CgeB